PLILDDALVYSDDQRIEHMFAALKRAAQTHQVLVLTCRERTFAGLGGHRLALGAWKTGYVCDAAGNGIVGRWGAPIAGAPSALLSK
ncbi:MAG: ATP-binding protein, partial [Hyphomicrobium sp.]